MGVDEGSPSRLPVSTVDDAAPSLDIGMPDELLYRSVLEAFPDVTVFVFGADLRYVLVSGGAYSRLGWRRGELEGRKPSEILPVAEGRELERHMLAALAGEVRRYEHGGIRDKHVEWSSTVGPVRAADGTIVAGMVVSRDVAGIRRAERARLESDQAQRRAVAEAATIRATSEQLQHGLLPPPPPAVPALAVAGVYRAASDTAEVGGDWFDVVEVRNGPGGGAVDVIVGDVQGHDGEAAALMARLASVVRADSQRGHDPVDIVRDLRLFHDSLATERLATIALARIDTRTGTVRMVNAGHPPPLLGRASGEVTVTASSVCPPIGAGDYPCEGSEVRLQPGDTLVLFSDGLLDPHADPDVALARATETTRTQRDVPLPDLVATLADSAAGYDPSDDVVVLAARWTPNHDADQA